MKGLLRKTFFEVRWPVVLFSTGLAAVMALLTALLPKVLGDAERIFQKLPFVKPLITALLGVDPGHGLTAHMMQAFLWVHPTVLSLLWAHALMYCTRVPAGEIDRGSVDFLLSQPVSRFQLYLAESIGFLLSGFIVMSVGCLGHLWASRFIQPGMQPGAVATMCVMANLFTVYVAVGGLALLVSSGSDRRGRAIGVMFGILLASFLLSFLAQFWEPAKSVSFLSMLQYYRSALIIQSGQPAWKDLALLTGIAGCCWGLGAVIFRRRSICTV